MNKNYPVLSTNLSAARLTILGAVLLENGNWTSGQGARPLVRIDTTGYKGM